MGTNYFLHESVCEHCKRPGKVHHIGKSSAGWCFSLHVLEPAEPGDPRASSLAEWEVLFRQPGMSIVDEEGDTVSADRMLDVIRNRAWRGGKPPTEDFLRSNSAVEGPNGLLRHRLGQFCIGHGEGPWDMLTGEFR